MTFDIDANGILNVTAKDRATNNEQKITITSSSGLAKDEVEKMARDAESHAAEDRKQKDTIDARNRADAMVRRHVMPASVERYTPSQSP